MFHTTLKIINLDRIKGQIPSKGHNISKMVIMQVAVLVEELKKTKRGIRKYIAKDVAVNNKVAQIFIASAGEVIKNVDNTATVMVHAQIWPPFNSGVFRCQ
jgi:hypothetical protein